MINATRTDLVGKRLALVGYGGANRAFLRALQGFDIDVTVHDQHLDLEVPEGTSAVLGASYLNGLGSYDLVVRAPGVRYWPELHVIREKVTTATQLFFNEVRATSAARIIAVTGTKGKSTTSAMIYEVCKHAGWKALLVGNIGNSDWNVLDEIDDKTTIVYEMSSYMLEDFTGRPDVAVVTSLFDDHISWHGSREGYRKAKLNIATHQNMTNDVLIYDTQDDVLSEMFQTAPGRLMPMVKHDLPELKIPGEHNRHNAQLVMTVAEELGIDLDGARDVLANFNGLEHRLEVVDTIDGLTYIDDSLATTPEAAQAAIHSFDHVAAMILGGEDRGYDYLDLARSINEHSVEIVALLPGGRDKLRSALLAAGFNGKIAEVNTLQEAVTACAEALSGVCLLSTAAPSFDQFENYKDKSQKFREAVVNLSRRT